MKRFLRTVGHFVKTDPVDVGKLLPQQSGDVGKIGDLIGNALSQGSSLLRDLFVICHGNNLIHIIDIFILPTDISYYK